MSATEDAARAWTLAGRALEATGAYDEALSLARRRLEEAASLCVARGGRA